MDYALTHSCYDPDASGTACGVCDSCLLRLKGFREAGIDDPIGVPEKINWNERETLRQAVKENEMDD